MPLNLGLDRQSGRTCSCTSMAICVRAQTEGVRKRGQSPEARTMKVHHSILQHRTDCYHFPLERMYMCVYVCVPVWFVHQACAAVSPCFPAARCASYVSKIASRMLRVAGPVAFPALACTLMSCSVGGLGRMPWGADTRCNAIKLITAGLDCKRGCI